MLSERVILSFPFNIIAKGSFVPEGIVSMRGSMHTRFRLSPFGLQITRVVQSEKETAILFPSSPSTLIRLDLIFVYNLEEIAKL